MLKRKRSTTSRAGSESRTTRSPPHSTAGLLNQLCSKCEPIFKDLKTHKPALWYEFHSIVQLRNSADQGCHVCSLLTSEAAQRDGIDSQDESPLKVKIRLFSNYGLSLYLVRESNAILYMDAYFREDLKPNCPRVIDARCDFGWDQVHTWVKNCSLHHEKCRARMADARHDQWPTRLLFVGDTRNPTVSLYEAARLAPKHGSLPKYMTLSHCWGGVTPMRLLQENLATFLTGIPFDELPRTFKDAVEDSAEDWATESSRMHYVYRNSYLNLAAGAATNSNGGFFYPRSPLSTVPFRIQVGTGAHARHAVTYYSPETSDSILFTRAWVVQERLLAPRQLIFGRNELHWECVELQASETFPEQAYSESKAEYKFWNVLENKTDEARLEMWRKLTNIYSSKKLSKAADKLVAISGLAAELGNTWSGKRYFAGLWSFHLRHSLLWRCEKPGGRYMQYSAPSWSWASLEGVTTLNEYTRYGEGLVKIRDVEVELLGPSRPYGAGGGGSIRLLGPILLATATQRGRLWNINFISPLGKTYYESLSSLGENWQVQEVMIDWDERLMADMAQSVNVYFAPFEITIFLNKIQIKGLVLQPTYQQKGQFRRIGYFQFGEKDILDPNSSNEEDLSDQNLSDEGNTSEVESAGDSESRQSIHYIPSGMAVKEYSDSILNQWKGEAKTDLRFLKLKKRMHNYRTIPPGSIENWGELLSANDPYNCGVVDTTLLHRFHRELGEGDYPRINNFLKKTAFFSELLLNLNDLPEFLQGTTVGDGYYTYEIV